MAPTDAPEKAQMESYNVEYTKHLKACKNKVKEKLAQLPTRKKSEISQNVQIARI